MFNFAQFVREPSTPTTLVPKRKGFLMMQEKIAPPDPLPVVASEPFDVLLSQRTIESLEQENAWLKERLAHIMRSQIAK
jgi:hypothetical protein